MPSSRTDANTLLPSLVSANTTMVLARACWIAFVMASPT
ncbi:MAG: hypothetical protein ACJASK_000654, partial [Ilumatobacter sp.]